MDTAKTDTRVPERGEVVRYCLPIGQHIDAIRKAVVLSVHPEDPFVLELTVMLESGDWEQRRSLRRRNVHQGAPKTRDTWCWDTDYPTGEPKDTADDNVDDIAG